MKRHTCSYNSIKRYWPYIYISRTWVNPERSCSMINKCLPSSLDRDDETSTLRVLLVSVEFAR